jgi:hypothetical protein
MTKNYTYKIYIFTKDYQAPVHNEITFSFTNPLIARSLAIKELQKIIVIADQQLTGATPSNPYGIPEWDNPILISETPEMNSILTPLTVELILDLGGTEYILYGAGVKETIEALSSEARQYRLDGLITETSQIRLLENVDWDSLTEIEQAKHIEKFMVGDDIAGLTYFESKESDKEIFSRKYISSCFTVLWKSTES